MQTRLTQAFVDKAKASPPADRTIFWDETLPGFGLMITAAGHKSFICQYRAGRRSRRLTIKGVLKLEDARKQAKIELGKVAKGGDPLIERRKAQEAAENTLKSIAEEYLRRDGKKLRTADWRRAVLERLVYPKLGTRQIADIRRSDIIRLLDRIEDERGPVMADRTLAVLRKIMNWHVGRVDDFGSPIVRGAFNARAPGKERARSRTLTDDELRAIWKAAEATTGPFGTFVQFLLLTGGRRSEAAAMEWSELEGSDWNLPGTRNKTKVDFVRPLSATALAVLAKVPKIEKSKLVFTTNGKRPISGFGKFKARLAKASGTADWRLHDLRRTARSLMSRAGVPADHAERCLGHVMPGIRATYDRYEYYVEKKQAFEALAGLIERILNPQDNVTQLRPAV